MKENNKKQYKNPLFTENNGFTYADEIEKNTLEIETPKHNFIVVYDSIYKNKNLNALELGLLLYLLSRAPTFKPNKNGLMYALNLSRRDYENTIKTLKKKGYLKIEQIGKHEYKYIVSQAPTLKTLNKELSYDALAPLYDLHYYNELYKLGFIEEELLNQLTEHFYTMVKTEWINNK